MPNTYRAPTQISSDASPKLSGSLDVNQQKIVSASNQNITLEPHGTGEVRVMWLLVSGGVGHLIYTSADVRDNQKCKASATCWVFIRFRRRLVLRQENIFVEDRTG